MSFVDFIPEGQAAGANTDGGYRDFVPELKPVFKPLEEVVPAEQVEEKPSDRWKKERLAEYATAHGIPFAEDATKKDILDLINTSVSEKTETVVTDEEQKVEEVVPAEQPSAPLTPVQPGEGE